MLKGERWNLVDLKRPKDKVTPYIILESLNSEKNSSRTIHTVIINSDKTAFSLGRGHDADLRINDISVSRKHANIEYKNGSWYFVDLKSKFGSLVLFSHDVDLSDCTSKTFQIGRTVLTLKAKLTQPWKDKSKQGKYLTNFSAIPICKTHYNFFIFLHTKQLIRSDIVLYNKNRKFSF